VAADVLLMQDPAEPVVARNFVKQCVALARQRVLQRRIASIESASKAYFESALQLAANRQLLEGPAEELRARREAFAGETYELVRRVDRLAGLAENRRSARAPEAGAGAVATGVTHV
jgi:glycerol-3-phosphate O-acyltransferase